MKDLSPSCRKPKVLYLTTDYLTTLCSCDTSTPSTTPPVVLPPFEFDGGNRTPIQGNNKRDSSDLTPEKRDDKKRRRLDGHHPSGFLDATIIKQEEKQEENGMIVTEIKENSVEESSTLPLTCTSLSSHQRIQDRESKEESVGKISDEFFLIDWNESTSRSPDLQDLFNDPMKIKSMPRESLTSERCHATESFSRPGDLATEKGASAAGRPTRVPGCAMGNSTTGDSAGSSRASVPSHSPKQGTRNPSYRFLEVAGVPKVSRFLQKHSINIWDFDRICLPVHLLTVHWALLVIDIRCV